MTEILEKLDFGCQETAQVLIPWDFPMTASQAKANVYAINHDLVELGAEIISVDFGPTLTINGQIIDNALKDKMLITVKRGLPFGERSMSDAIFSRFLEFLRFKTIPDPVEVEKVDVAE